jgi:hypothetical protein
MKSNPGPPMTVGNAAKAEHCWAIISRLPSTPLRLPFILCLRISLRLPLHVRDRISTAAGERQDVVLDVTGVRTSHATGRRARVHQLELALDRGRSRLFGGSGARQNNGDGERGGNEQSGRHRVPNFAPGSSARCHSAQRLIAKRGALARPPPTDSPKKTKAVPAPISPMLKALRLFDRAPHIDLIS